jgi:hypothetical protein
MAKEGYKPTAGMQSAARRAIKLKEQGKAKGAGTSVGWTRAGQLARGETLSLSTVKRMYSFFSRHEVDKKGKDWDNAENPSNGKIMWLAWGGDAGFSWSRKITQKEKTMKKNLELNEMVEEIKDMLDDVVNPITEVVEIEDDLEKAKSMKEIMTQGKDESDEDYAKRMKEHKKDMAMEEQYSKAEELSDEDISKNYESDNQDEDKWDNVEKACWSGYTQRGMKDKNGRMVPNCVPVEKAHDVEEKEEVKKSAWNHMFDPNKFDKKIF